jgi:uncharacterized protein YbjT (DUF2867 family)
MSVLVLGATGSIGAAVVAALSERGVATRAGVRDPTSEKAVGLGNLKGVELVQADLGDGATLAKAFAGVTTVFVNTPGAEDCADLVATAVAAAKTARVRSITVISVSQVDTKADILFKRQFSSIETTVKESGVPYTVIRLPMFMENQWASHGTIQADRKIYGSADPTKPSAFVAVADVGDAVATVLSAPDAHANKTYTLTSDVLSFGGIAAAFSTAIGNAVEYVRMPYDESIETIVELGFPRWQAVGVSEILKLVDDGDATAVGTTTELQGLLGRAPTSFAVWVGQVAAAFKA